MYNTIDKSASNSIKNISQYPSLLKEKFKLSANKNACNFTSILKYKQTQNKNSFKLSKNNKLKFNKTASLLSEKSNFPKVKILTIKKEKLLNPKLKHMNSLNLNQNQKARYASQEMNQRDYLSKNFNDIYIKKLEQEKINEKDVTNNEDEEDKYSNLNMNELMDKIKKEYSDIGKIIKVIIVVNCNLNYVYEKNEHVLLKIIENDLKENYGLYVKEFLFNNTKLNVYKTLKENNIENNSIINIIL